MTLAAATEAYQAQWEHSRRARELGAPDDALAEIDEDVARARREMEIAWLAQVVA